MRWTDEVLKWMATHPLRVDVAVVVVVTGIIIYLLKYQRAHRRIIHRRIWAMYLKRKDLERLHLMRFEDAITDAAFEMVARGEMTDRQEAEWYAFFAEQYGMKGLRPGHGRGNPEALKKGIKTRLNFWWGKIKPNFPPVEPQKVDPTYDGKHEVKKFKSKYAEE